METASIRVPKELYDALRVRAAAERRSATSMAAILLEDALRFATKDPQRAEPWPEPTPDPVPVTAAEKEYATGDPVEAAPLQPGAVDDAWPEPEPTYEKLTVPIVEAS